MKRLALAMTAFLALGACSSAPPSVDGEWRLVSVITDGAVLQVPQSARERASVNLAMDDGWLTTAAACNLASGSYTFDAETRVLTGDAFATTLMGCPLNEEFDFAIVTMLSGDPIDVMLLGDTMLWTVGDRTLRFVSTGEM